MTIMREILTGVRNSERDLLRTSVRFVRSNVLKTAVRQTRHFREWFRCPMNYARVIELPLTLRLLDATPTDKILDVSSPKLLALHYALSGYAHVVAADLESYFVDDFEKYRQHAGLSIETAVFDAAKRIPFPDNHFDKIFSISVLEHIPDNGDTLAMHEMLRVLKPGGTLVVTLPAFSKYTEEWLSGKDFYWTSVKDDQGRVFYQRRYDSDAVQTRIAIPNAVVSDTLLVAEKPLAEAHLDTSGKMLHNSYYVDRIPMARAIRKWGRRINVIPFTTYLAERMASQRCHYVTDDWNDPNIRQVAVKLIKEPTAGNR